MQWLRWLRCCADAANTYILELGLGGLEHTVELGRQHDVALDLELAGHERLLGVDLAVGEADKGVVGEGDGDVWGQRGLSLTHLASCRRPL